MARLARLATVVAGYAAVACGTTWPLPRQLRTHLLGDPFGDLGIYVWNLWIFRHELIDHGRLPFSTDHIFGYTGGADFSLHNYTPIAGLLALPLMDRVGVVATFNLVFLALVVLAALGVFVLARRLGLGPGPAWCAGALFVASPAFGARETAHLSLINAAPLPLFLWALLRTMDSRRAADALLVGALAAAAAYSDAYYGVYCALMGSFVLAWHAFRVSRPASVAPRPGLAAVLNAAIACLLGLMAWTVTTGATHLTVGPVQIWLRTLYTPMLLVLALVGVRAWLTWGPVVELRVTGAAARDGLRLGLVSGITGFVLLTPWLAGIWARIASDRLPDAPLYWRSTPRGVDLLAYLVPNPGHPWFGSATQSWFMPDRPDVFPELVGSFSLVALAAIGLAAWRRRLPARWVGFAVCFGALSLGPFVHVAGVNTYVIGPWALLRYVPVVGLARSPSRLALVAILGLSLLFAFALEALVRCGRRWRWAAGGLAAAMAVELLAAPRPLYSAAVPDIYALVTHAASDSRRLLDLPTGVRDGLSSLGNFSAASNYFQTAHGRPLIGGYLSRVSTWRKRENERAPMLHALFALSEGRALAPSELEEARRSRADFLRRSCIGFVVLDKHRASGQLRTFAVTALDLMPVHEDAAYALYAPIDPPPCEPPADRVRPRGRVAWWPGVSRPRAGP
jgi:hypothetical protein